MRRSLNNSIGNTRKKFASFEEWKFQLDKGKLFFPFDIFKNANILFYTNKYRWKLKLMEYSLAGH